MIPENEIYTLLQGEAAPEIWERAAQKVENCNISDFIIDDTTDTTALHPVFTLGGVEVMHRGDVSALMGVVKSGKSAAAGLLARAVLSDNPAAVIRGAAVPTNEPAKVLYFDTEQSKIYAKRHYLEITGGQRLHRLKYVATAENSPNERRLLLELAVRTYAPDLVIIDGIADLMTDTNNNTEAAAVVQIVRTLASLYNCHILSVIHKNNGNSDKARGHIGSELFRKCECVMDCTKAGDGGDPCFELSYPITRGRQPRQISFKRGEGGEPYENATPEERLRQALDTHEAETIDFATAERVCRENAIPFGSHPLRAFLRMEYGEPEREGKAGKSVWRIRGQDTAGETVTPARTPSAAPTAKKGKEAQNV